MLLDVELMDTRRIVPTAVTFITKVLGWTSGDITNSGGIKLYKYFNTKMLSSGPTP